ncbi:MAG: ATP-binding protein [Chitinophagales bacterium]
MDALTVAVPKMVQTNIDQCLQKVIALPNNAYFEKLQILREANELAQSILPISLLPQIKVFDAYEEFYNSLGDFTKQIYYLEKRNEFTLNHQLMEEYIKGCFKVGRLHIERSQFENALNTFYELQIFVDKYQPNKKHVIYNSLGSIYFRTENYVNASNYFHKALEAHYNSEVEDSSNICICYNNLGAINGVLKNYTEALAYFRKGLALSEQKGMVALQGKSYYNMVCILVEQKNYQEGWAFATKALQIFEQEKNNRMIVKCRIALSELHVKQKQFDAAVDELKTGLATAQLKCEKSVLAEIYLQFTELYEEMGQYKQSLYYRKRYHEEKERKMSLERQKTLVTLQAKYEMVQKDAEIQQLHDQQKLLIEKNAELELFASKAAHDLKEPIRMINSFGTLLKKQKDRLSETDKEEFLDTIVASSGRMNRLLVRLLEFARAGTKNYQFIEMDLNDLAFQVIQDLQLLIAEKDATIQIEPLPTIVIAPVAIQQVLQNLISNALKFQVKEKKISVIVDCKIHNNTYILSVKDNGIGISTAHQERIFHAFERLHTRQEYAGSGLGLAICKKIMQSLEGDLWVQSTEGEGATFFVALPKREQ